MIFALEIFKLLICFKQTIQQLTKRFPTGNEIVYLSHLIGISPFSYYLHITVEH